MKQGGWHTPHVSKRLRRQQEGLKTNARDDRSEFPFHEDGGWGMDVRVVIKDENPPDPFQSVLLFCSVFINPSSATI